MQVLHDGPHHGEHVFGDALSVGSGGIGEHGSGLQDAGSLVFVDAGTPGLQPFEFGALRAFLGRDVADDRGGFGFEFLRYCGGPAHASPLGRIADEFLWHVFRGTYELRTFGFSQRQAVDDQFAVVPYSHAFYPMTIVGYRVSRWVLGQTPSSSVSRMMVTGPSLARRTRMWEPNRPSFTSSPCERRASLNPCHVCSACAGAPAFTKFGRLPLRTSAYSVNWEMDSTLPFTSWMERFILPFSSSKTRRLAILRASQSICFAPSVSSTPTSST